eukprot:1501592-Prymnesium_polylepis.2
MRAQASKKANAQDGCTHSAFLCAGPTAPREAVGRCATRHVAKHTANGRWPMLWPMADVVARG